MAKAVLTELVKFGRGRYDADAPARDLRHKVVEAVDAWAGGERLAEEDVRLGLTLATTVMARHGLSSDVIADLNYDAGAATERVLQVAKSADTYWGTEDHYAVAERCLGQTYNALIGQMRENEPILLPAVRALRHGLEKLEATLKAQGLGTESGLRELSAALVEAASTAEMIAYLRTRIADWDVSIWRSGRPTQSMLEQRLRVRIAGLEPSTPAGVETTAEEALVGRRMLIVLGGPGSGKSWLAHRYARESAQVALQQLESGADLDAVEVPLFTTWDRWAHTPGSPREALVEASFSADLGHSDLGGGGVVDRLRRRLTERNRKVLLVVDSLDEAADKAGQVNRLRELSALVGWRVIVTSRAAAWHATCRGEADPADGAHVVELQPVTYPEDVERFVRAWFLADPDRGESLIDQIEARADLAQAAVIPLMLTFYCLLAEAQVVGQQPLPARRHELYNRLVKRLLRGRWTPNAAGPDTAPNQVYCEGVLRSWAWHAVKDRVTSVGLGDWGESFIQPSDESFPLSQESRALDHIAPKLAEDDEGQVTRRFVHRTVLEHLVADHIAGLEATAAAEALSPHLWFDPDWSVAAPAAIVAHNHRDRGSLLEQLLHRGNYPAMGGPAWRVATAEFDALLLAVAEYSDPGDWLPDHQLLLHTNRKKYATKRPDAMARTAHWTESNEEVRCALLAELPSAYPDAVDYLVATLPVLGATDMELAKARAAVLAALPAAHPVLAVAELALVLKPLGATDLDLADARAVVLAGISDAHPMEAVPALTAALNALDATEGERAMARVTVLAALRAADPYAIDYLVTVLVALGATDLELAEARGVVLDVLPAANSRRFAGLVAALNVLGATDLELAEARGVLLDALAATDPLDVPKLVVALPRLKATDSELVQARRVVLDALDAHDPRTAASLAAALPPLNATDLEMVQARASLVTALSGLDVFAEVFADDFAVIFDDLVEGLVETLNKLDATDSEQAEARAALVAALPAADPGLIVDLVRGLNTLGATDPERAMARAAVLDALPDADGWEVASLGTTLSGLVATDMELAEARAAVLNALPNTAADAVVCLAAALNALKATDLERADARAAVLGEFYRARLTLFDDLLAALNSLEATSRDRDGARAELLAALPDATSRDIENLVANLRAVSPMPAWLHWLSGGVGPAQ